MSWPTLRILALAVTGVALGGATASISGCASNPATGGTDIVLTSEAKEIEMGKRMHQQIMQQYTRYDDERLQSYVNELGQKLYPRRRFFREATAVMRRRVVWGRGETAATWAPASALASVDLPTFGRPARATRPERKLTPTAGR